MVKIQTFPVKSFRSLLLLFFVLILGLVSAGAQIVPRTDAPLEITKTTYRSRLLGFVADIKEAEFVSETPRLGRSGSSQAAFSLEMTEQVVRTEYAHYPVSILGDPNSAPIKTDSLVDKHVLAVNDLSKMDFQGTVDGGESVKRATEGILFTAKENLQSRPTNTYFVTDEIRKQNMQNDLTQKLRDEVKNPTKSNVFLREDKTAITKETTATKFYSASSAPSTPTADRLEKTVVKEVDFTHDNTRIARTTSRVSVTTTYPAQASLPAQVLETKMTAELLPTGFHQYKKTTTKKDPATTTASAGNNLIIETTVIKQTAKNFFEVQESSSRPHSPSPMTTTYKILGKNEVRLSEPELWDVQKELKTLKTPGVPFVNYMTTFRIPPPPPAPPLPGAVAVTSSHPPRSLPLLLNPGKFGNALQMVGDISANTYRLFNLGDVMPMELNPYIKAPMSGGYTGEQILFHLSTNPTPGTGNPIKFHGTDSFPFQQTLSIMDFNGVKVLSTQNYHSTTIISCPSAPGAGRRRRSIARCAGVITETDDRHRGTKNSNNNRNPSTDPSHVQSIKAFEFLNVLRRPDLSRNDRRRLLVLARNNKEKITGLDSDVQAIIKIIDQEFGTRMRGDLNSNPNPKDLTSGQTAAVLASAAAAFTFGQSPSTSRRNPSSSSSLRIHNPPSMTNPLGIKLPGSNNNNNPELSSQTLDSTNRQRVAGSSSTVDLAHAQTSFKFSSIDIPKVQASKFKMPKIRFPTG